MCKQLISSCHHLTSVLSSRHFLVKLHLQPTILFNTWASFTSLLFSFFHELSSSTSASSGLCKRAKERERPLFHSPLVHLLFELRRMDDYCCWTQPTSNFTLTSGHVHVNVIQLCTSHFVLQLFEATFSLPTYACISRSPNIRICIIDFHWEPSVQITLVLGEDRNSWWNHLIHLH